MTNDVYTEMKHLCIFLSINYLQAIMLCFESCEISIFYPFDKWVRFVATVSTDGSVREESKNGNFSWLLPLGVRHHHPTPFDGTFYHPFFTLY